MSDERNIPDDLWRKAFDEAAETPPPRVWDVIERRLDESDGPKVLPLWGAGPAVSRPMAWGVGLAAAVALLLVGWWIMRPDSSHQPMVAQSQSSAGQQQEVAQTPRSKQAESIPATDPAEAIGSAQQRVATDVQPERVVPEMGGGLSAPLQSERTVSLSGRRSAGGRLTNEGGNQPGVQPTADVADNILAGPVNRSTSVALMNQPAAARSSEPIVTEPLLENRTLVNFERLASRSLQLRTPGLIQRIVWFRPAEADAPEITAPKAKRDDREMWASVSMMPGAFNPSVSAQLPSVAAVAPSMSAAPPVSQPAINSRANFSVAYQAGAGVQLTERWSIESGVGYLAARSTVDSPGQMGQFALQAAAPGNNAIAGNLYADLLRTQTGQAVVKSGIYGMVNDNLSANSRFNNLNNYDTRTRQSVTNNYQYVQVPVQIGYQLRPRKRLSLAVVGGLLTNIFVRNTVDDALVINAKDGVYRPVSWAATMGAQFRYRPSRRWSASMAGVYQPSLGFGTEADSPIQSRPTSTGMTFGIDYHF